MNIIGSKVKCCAYIFLFFFLYHWLFWSNTVDIHCAMLLAYTEYLQICSNNQSRANFIPALVFTTFREHAFWLDKTSFCVGSARLWGVTSWEKHGPPFHHNIKFQVQNGQCIQVVSLPHYYYYYFFLSQFQNDRAVGLWIGYISAIAVQTITCFEGNLTWSQAAKRSRLQREAKKCRLQ